MLFFEKTKISIKFFFCHRAVNSFFGSAYANSNLKSVWSIWQLKKMNQTVNENHTCTVEKQTSGSFLPPLQKEANCFQRFIRKYKKFIQVSEKDPLTQEYFRSTTGFLNERKRHAQSKYSYIIHPFSDFGCVRFCSLYLPNYWLSEVLWYYDHFSSTANALIIFVLNYPQKQTNETKLLQILIKLL